MVNLAEINADLKLEFPCDWEYKIFLEHSENVQTFLNSLDLKPLKLKKSKENAKYTCYDASFRVNSNHERLELFSLLKKHAKFIL